MCFFAAGPFTWRVWTICLQRLEWPVFHSHWRWLHLKRLQYHSHKWGASSSSHTLSSSNIESVWGVWSILNLDMLLKWKLIPFFNCAPIVSSSYWHIPFNMKNNVPLADEVEYEESPGLLAGVITLSIILFLLILVLITVCLLFYFKPKCVCRRKYFHKKEVRTLYKVYIIRLLWSKFHVDPMTMYSLNFISFTSQILSLYSAMHAFLQVEQLAYCMCV